MKVPRVLSAALLVVLLTSSVANASPEALDPLAFQIHAQYLSPSSELIETRQDGIIGVPAMLDVDHQITTGTGGADILVQLTIDAGRATARATVLPNAPATLPVKIELILSDPRGSSPLRVAYGYDALASTAPAVYNATIQLIGAARVTSFGLDIQTVGAGSTLAVIAEVFTLGDGGERLDPQRGSIRYTPVPTAAHFGVLQGSDLGIQQSGLDLTTDTPTRVDVVIEDVRDDASLRADATIDVLPNVLSLVLADSDDGRRTWNYNASARVESIALSVRDVVGSSVVDTFQVNIADMAESAALVQDTATHATFQASSPIGALEVGLASGREIAWLDEAAYLYATSPAGSGSESLAFRILGLSSAELDTGVPLIVEVAMLPGPFHVLVEDGSARIDGWVRDMPSRLRLTFNETTGAVSWTGSAPIGEITVDASDPTGIAGRATALHLLLRDIPQQLSLTYGESNGSASIDAHGSTIGLIEVQLTSGPDERLPASVDGILVKDVADRYVVFARITGLRKLSITQQPSPQLSLQTLGGRVFVADLNEQEGSKLEYTRVRLDSLPTSVEVSATSGAADRFTYSASSAANSIELETNSGDRHSLKASLAPLPAKVTLCSAGDGACNGYIRPSGSGSISFDASAHTTLNVLDCKTQACDSSFTRVTNLYMRHLDFDADASDLGISGYVFMNTAAQPGASVPDKALSGSLRFRDDGVGADATFGTNFWAVNRKVEWELWGLFKDKSGVVSCTPGTDLRAFLLGFSVNIKGFLC